MDPAFRMTRIPSRAGRTMSWRRRATSGLGPHDRRSPSARSPSSTKLIKRTAASAKGCEDPALHWRRAADTFVFVDDWSSSPTLIQNDALDAGNATRA